ncbi:MAG: hypothetical protein HY314_08345 [Acidobacteria bacterium]|nr:hypothetical protein [Acidobacteriota bacterium]
MTPLVSTLRIDRHRTGFVVLAVLVLIIGRGVISTAIAAQQSEAMLLKSASAQITPGQESKVEDPTVIPTSIAFIYQGQLKDSSNPVNGAFDFQFVLYSAQTGGERLGANELKDMALTNGLFSFKLDFGRAVVDTKESWLEIGVRPSGRSELYTVLFPRQKLTPTPYAIFAQQEQWSLIGVPVGFAGDIGKDAVITDETADQGSAGAKKVSELTGKASDSLKGRATDAESKVAAAPQGTVDTIAKFVDATNLGDSIIVETGSGSDRKIGIGTSNPPSERLHVVQSGNYQLRLENPAAGGGFWSIGQSDNSFNTGGDKLLFVPNSTNSSNAKVVFTNAGNVGIGTPDPFSKLTIVSSTPDQSVGMIHVQVTQPFLTGGHRILYARKRNSTNSASLDWFLGMEPGDTPTLSVTRVERRDGQSPSFVFPLAIAWNGNIGIGTMNPGGKLEIAGQDALRLAGFQPFLTLIDTSSGRASRIQTANNSLSLLVADSNFNFQERLKIDINGNVGIGTANPQAKLDVAGMTRTGVLQITGGGDLAEPFEITGAESIQPGMLVAIDPNHPGHLRIADKAYDRTVAGVISGANGINPGLTMKQTGTVADGEHPVALTGRVYCWADASFEAIEPGDLLTTSDTPGHAMKVSDHAMAHGAIIGKAMTGLKEGKGLVLVLVMPQ